MYDEFGITAAAWTAKLKAIRVQKSKAKRERPSRARPVEVFPVEQRRDVFMTPHGPAYAVAKEDTMGRALQRITLPWCSIQGR